MQRVGADRRKIIVFSVVMIALTALFVVIDQLTKAYFKKAYSPSDEKYIIDGFFYFTYTFNTGAAFSLFADKPWGQLFFKILTSVALVLFVLLFIFSLRKRYKLLTISLVFLISGALGNFIDRIRFDGVVDFIGLIFFGWKFPTFNIADTCMCVGVILIIIHYFFIDKHALFKKNDKKNVSDKQQ